MTSTILPDALANLLTTEEVAELLNCSPTTLATWRCTRRYPLEWVKVGRAVRYVPASVWAFVQSRTVGGEPDEAER
jgi:hypothetical protein